MEDKKVTLEFPKLHNALSKDVKHLNDDDPRRGIIVLSGHAIVINDDFCLAVDLYDFFTLDQNIEDEEEISELKKILFYMNGKVFQPEYWKEIAQFSNMKMHNGMIYIESPKYAKDLHYKELDINLHEPLNNLIRAKELPENLISEVSLPFGAIAKILETLKKDFKLDHIILKFDRQDSPVRFTFKNRKHFFGYIVPHYDSVQEGFKFEHLANFAGDEMVLDMMKEHAPVTAPPAPHITGERPRDLDDDQESLFGGDIYD